jgi:hypothetical protein
VLRRARSLVIVASLVAGALGAIPSPSSSAKAPDGRGDATVVAVIDGGLVPYHWDFVASKMPQATDKDPSNDLPLDTAPDKWLPGFPAPAKAFSSYNRFELTLDEDNPDTAVASLDGADKPKWDAVKPSTPKDINYYWMPGTKVIGAIEFGGGKIHGTPTSHGNGTTSVSVGNLHGTCPECLLLFINGASEEAIEWAMDQPWIDAITNSYGFSAAYRDRIYSGSDVEAQRDASHRGQTIFFSAGNGQDGAFVVPNTTSFSSQEGPDWIVTVGAVSPGNHASYTGHGKPADIAGIGSRYPAAYGSTTVGGTGTGGFGGTSNATPTIAGTYARALYLARRDLAGPSSVQRDGVIARGGGFKCGAARFDCELGDGKLTAVELRTRLFHGAVHTPAGMTPGPQGIGELPPVGEDEFLNEGHGSYFARETGKVKAWLKEFERVIAPLEGRRKALKRPDGEREWMIVDSYCRQAHWGLWRNGYYVHGKTKLPGSDPNYPMRSAMEEACKQIFPE